MRKSFFTWPFFDFWRWGVELKGRVEGGRNDERGVVRRNGRHVEPLWMFGMRMALASA